MTDTTKPRPSLRQAHKDMTRARIAGAARACFYAKGVAETSFEEIAAAAGVRRATVYLHFANKNAILIELIAENLEDVFGIYARLCDLGAPDKSAVSGWLEHYIRALRKHQQAMRLFHVAMAVDGAYGGVIRSYRQRVIELLGTRYQAFDIADDDTKAIRHARATLMIVRIDHFVNAVSQIEAEMDMAAGLDLVSEELAAMLQA